MIEYLETGLPEKEHAQEYKENNRLAEKKKPSIWQQASAIHLPKRGMVIFLFVVLILLTLGGVGYLLYNHLYIYFNANYLLTKRYADYNRVVDAGYCDQAYNFLSLATKEKISQRLYNFVCQQQRDYLTDQYIDEKGSAVFFNVTGRTGVVTAQRKIQDEGRVAEYSENYLFVLEKGNWYRDFSESQADFYYQEALSGKNKAFMDCLLRKNQAESKTWEEEGKPEDWRYTKNEQGELEYNWEEGSAHFDEACAQEAVASEAGQLVEEIGIQ